MTLPKKNSLVEIENLILQGNYGEAIDAIREAEEKKQSKRNLLRYRILKVECLDQLSKFDDALSLAHQIVNHSKKSKKYEFELIDGLYWIAAILWRLARYQEAIEVIQEAEEKVSLIDEDIEVRVRKGKLMRIRGWILYRQSEYDKALEYFLESLRLVENTSNPIAEARAHNGIGSIYHLKSDYKSARKFYRKSLRICEDIGNQRMAAKVLNNIGNLQKIEGNLDSALEYYHKALVVYEELGGTGYEAYTVRAIGGVHEDRGELDLAYDYVSKSLEIAKKTGHKRLISGCTIDLGCILYEQGEFDLALDALQKGLELANETGSALNAAQSLIYQLFIAVAKNEQENAEAVLQSFQKIAEGIDELSVEYEFAQAIVLKMSQRALHRGKAEELLAKIVNGKTTTNIIKEWALLHLCEILLIEFKTSSQEEVLSEIDTYIRDLLTMAENHRSYLLLVDTYVLQSRLALLNLDLMEARRLLTEAQTIAEEKGLGRLAKKVSDEHDRLLDELQRWESISEKDSTLRERAELAELDEQFTRMIRERGVEETEFENEEPVSLFILTQAGLGLYSKIVESITKVETHLIAGFLNAIQSFTEEVFSQGIDRIKLEDYTLIIKVQDPVTIVYVFKGQSYLATRKLSEFAELLPTTENIWQSIIQFDITGKTLETEVENQLDTLFETVFIHAS